MKKALFILAVAIAIPFISCSDNKMAKKYGGTETIKLAPNEKLINATWKDTNLWYLVEDTITKQRIFKEKSSIGWLEGKIIFTK